MQLLQTIVLRIGPSTVVATEKDGVNERAITRHITLVGLGAQVCFIFFHSEFPLEF